MGNNISSSIIPPPLSLNDCLVDGELDLMWYYMYKMRLIKQSFQSTALHDIIRLKRKRCYDTLASNKHSKKKRMKRTMTKYQLWIRDSDGILRRIQPTDTMWFKLYVDTQSSALICKRCFGIASDYVIIVIWNCCLRCVEMNYLLDGWI